jgi:cell division protein FtsW
VIDKDTRDILLAVTALVLIGLLMIYSSTVVIATRKFGNGFIYLRNQIFTACVSAAAMAVIFRLDYRRFRSVVYLLMGLSLVLLLAVFIPGIGREVNGAKRWIQVWPSRFQPSEFAKLVMVIFLADYMDRFSGRMREFRYGIAIPVGIMVVFQLILIKQPDFGAVMSLGILTVGLLVLGGARLSHVGMLVLAALPAVFALVVSSPYRLRRIMCFTDPWREPFDCGFQLIQSFIAFGNGGILGLGLGGSRQKLYFLPEVHTDFIFSIIGEELGLVGALAVMGLFVWLVAKGLKVASRASDAYSYYLALGLTMMIGVQALVNFAVSTGLMPTKGLPLPFVSYGGSALLVNMMAAGILAGISTRNGEKATQKSTGPGAYAIRTRRRGAL